MTIFIDFHHHPYYDTHGQTTIAEDRIIVKLDETLVTEDDGLGGKVPKTFRSVTEVDKWLLSNVGVSVEETHRYG